MIAGDVEGTVRMIGLFNTTIDASRSFTGVSLPFDAVRAVGQEFGETDERTRPAALGRGAWVYPDARAPVLECPSFHRR